MSELYGWLAGVLALIGGAVVLFLKGRKVGKAAEQAVQARKDLAVEKKRNEDLSTAVKTGTDVAGMSDADVQQRLRDKFSRDSDKRDLRLGEADLDK